MSNSNNRGSSVTNWVIAFLLAALIIIVLAGVLGGGRTEAPPNAPAAAESRDGAGPPATSRNGNEPG